MRRLLTASFDWAVAGAQVRVNPELGLRIKGVTHVIKLHFKKTDVVPEHEAQVMMSVMRDALGDSLGDECVMCILDVRQQRLWTEDASAGLSLEDASDAARDLQQRWENAA